MKTNEELNQLKEEIESVNEKLQELTEEEFAQVSGGRPRVIELPCEDPLWGVSAHAL